MLNRTVLRQVTCYFFKIYGSKTNYLKVPWQENEYENKSYDFSVTSLESLKK